MQRPVIQIGMTCWPLACTTGGTWLGFTTAEREMSRRNEYDRAFVLERTLRYASVGMAIGVFPPVGLPLAWWMIRKRLKSSG